MHLTNLIKQFRIVYLIAVFNLFISQVNAGADILRPLASYERDDVDNAHFTVPLSDTAYKEGLVTYLRTITEINKVLIKIQKRQSLVLGQNFLKSYHLLEIRKNVILRILIAYINRRTSVLGGVRIHKALKDEKAVLDKLDAMGSIEIDPRGMKQILSEAASAYYANPKEVSDSLDPFVRFIRDFSVSGQKEFFDAKIKLIDLKKDYLLAEQNSINDKNELTVSEFRLARISIQKMVLLLRESVYYGDAASLGPIMQQRRAELRNVQKTLSEVMKYVRSLKKNRYYKMLVREIKRAELILQEAVRVRKLSLIPELQDIFNGGEKRRFLDEERTLIALCCFRYLDGGAVDDYLLSCFATDSWRDIIAVKYGDLAKEGITKIFRTQVKRLQNLGVDETEAMITRYAEDESLADFISEGDYVRYFGENGALERVLEKIRESRINEIIHTDEPRFLLPINPQPEPSRNLQNTLLAAV